MCTILFFLPPYLFPDDFEIFINSLMTEDVIKESGEEGGRRTLCLFVLKWGASSHWLHLEKGEEP